MGYVACMNKEINIYEAKARLSRLIAEAERGQVITICRNHRPVADLVPHRATPTILSPDPTLAGARFAGDPTEGVSPEDWPEDQR